MRIPNSPAAVCSEKARRFFATDELSDSLGRPDGQSKSEDLQDHESVFMRFVLSRKEAWRIVSLFIGLLSE